MLKEHANVPRSGRDDRKAIPLSRGHFSESELTAEAIEVLFPKSSEGPRRRIAPHTQWQLTVKLRGRAEVPNGAEGAQFPSARGAKQEEHHGPLQRLLAAIWHIVKAALNPGLTRLVLKQTFLLPPP
jgi:hypothetical protein